MANLHLSVDVRPYPGMEHIERSQLGRIAIALAELEDLALRRSIPLTLKLLRLAVQERVVDLPQTGADGKIGECTRAQAAALRNVAMYGLARVCMLRKPRGSCLAVHGRSTAVEQSRAVRSHLRGGGSAHHCSEMVH